MKVQVKDLKPKPYRDMKNYPINREKVETLKNSIKKTEFWDNVLGRQINGEIQIAYGHHRLIALQELKIEEVDIPIKELTDALMIQIMANENMEEWKMSSGIIDETVRIAQKFLKENIEEAKKYGNLNKQNIKYKNAPLVKEAYIGCDIIASFLDWPETRITYALERLKLINKGELDKEAVHSLPTDTSARTFVKHVKSTKLSKKEQKQVAKEAIETENFGDDSIGKNVIEAKWKPEKKDVEKEKQRKKKMLEFDTFLNETHIISNGLSNRLKEIQKFKDELGSDLIVDKLSASMLTASLKRLYNILSNLLKDANNEN